MSEILPFKKVPAKHCEYSKEAYLWFILAGLNKIYESDSQAKAEFIMTACPNISIGILERFNLKVSAAAMEHYAKLKVEEGEPCDEGNDQASKGETLKERRQKLRETPTTKEQPVTGITRSAEHPEDPAAEVGTNEPVSLRAHLEKLDGYYARVFAHLSPAAMDAIALCWGTGVLTDEDIHGLALCMKFLSESKVKVLAPTQMDHWSYCWHWLMTALRGQGLKEVVIIPGCPAASTSGTVHPWTTC